MATLSAKAKEMLDQSNCFDEIADDCLSVANSGILILLSTKAVADLNRQAREQDA